MRSCANVRLGLVLLVLVAHLDSCGAPETCKERIKANHLSQLCQSRRKQAAEIHQQHVVDGWMESYDRLTRPALATKMATLGSGGIRGKHVDHENISVGLFVNQVWDIDQRAGSFKVQAQLRLLWQDDRLCFDGANLHHPRINLDQDSMQNLTTGVSILESLWLPDVHFHNSIHSGTEELPDAQLLRVSECGEVLWARRFIVTLWVDFDFAQLPFDSQLLKIELESYRMPVEDVVLKWTGGCDRSHDYTGVANQSNPEWQFSDIMSKPDSDDGFSICTTSVKTETSPGSKDLFSRAVMNINVKREEAMWITGYINPSWTLLLMSYLGLFIGNHNPGRPGVHAITILAHLTIDSSIRAQLPAIADSTWITDFQAGILYFHVAIFIEYCICHYAYRQKKKVKKERNVERSSLLEVELGTIYDGRENALARDSGAGDSIHIHRGVRDLNQRRAAQYASPDTPSPSAGATRLQAATPEYSPGGTLEPRATFAVSDEEDLAILMGSSSSRGCLWQIAAALDPEKWPRTTALLTEGTAGLTRLDWIARLVMPLLFWVFYMWSYWYKRS